jgi:hypothetical protein
VILQTVMRNSATLNQRVKRFRTGTTPCRPVPPDSSGRIQNTNCTIYFLATPKSDPLAL